MSVHRSFMVLHPQCKQGLNWARQRLLLAAVWALACLLPSPVIAARDVEEKDGRLKCLATVYKSGWKKVSLLLLETLAGFVLPYMVLATSYFCISRRVSRMARPKGKRLWKLIMWIVLTFFVFWLPYHAFNILHVATMTLTGSSKDKVTGLKMVLDRGSNIAGALAFINSCINPFLYALASRSLRGRITYISIRKLFRNSTTAESHALDSRKALNQHDSQNTQTPCPIRKDEL
ncbi:AGTRA protein, partial [Amia calva]|nr:AGTRA protein [Amia calva]